MERRARKKALAKLQELGYTKKEAKHALEIPNEVECREIAREIQERVKERLRK